MVLWTKAFAGQGLLPEADAYELLRCLAVLITTVISEQFLRGGKE